MGQERQKERQESREDINGLREQLREQSVRSSCTIAKARECPQGQDSRYFKGHKPAVQVPKFHDFQAAFRMGRKKILSSYYFLQLECKSAIESTLKSIKIGDKNATTMSVLRMGHSVIDNDDAKRAWKHCAVR